MQPRLEMLLKLLSRSGRIPQATSSCRSHGLSRDGGVDLAGIDFGARRFRGTALCQVPGKPTEREESPSPKPSCRDEHGDLL